MRAVYQFFMRIFYADFLCRYMRIFYADNMRIFYADIMRIFYADIMRIFHTPSSLELFKRITIYFTHLHINCPDDFGLHEGPASIHDLVPSESSAVICKKDIF